LLRPGYGHNTKQAPLFWLHLSFLYRWATLP
jgi:hypothetical protein